jgi:hypothetical protein
MAVTLEATGSEDRQDVALKLEFCGCDRFRLHRCENEESTQEGTKAGHIENGVGHDGKRSVRVSGS